MFVFTKKNIKQIEKKINEYLKEIEAWLCKWKMRMSAQKCNYCIFSRNKREVGSFNFNLKLFNENIPRVNNPTFLGVTLDSSLCFNKHIAKTFKNAFVRLNIIKILSHKSWKLSPDTLFNIYKALIGSIFNYSSFCANLISTKWMKKLQVIQNSAVRCIFKLPYDTESSHLHTIASAYNLPTVKERMFKLNQDYISRSINFSNPIIVQLIDEYQRGFGGGRNISKPTPLCANRLLIEDFFDGTDIYDDI
jgi:hypothetical protein